MYQATLETIQLNNLTNVTIYQCTIGDYDGDNSLKHIDDLGQEMGPTTS